MLVLPISLKNPLSQPQAGRTKKYQLSHVVLFRSSIFQSCFPASCASFKRTYATKRFQASKTTKQESTIKIINPTGER